MLWNQLEQTVDLGWEFYGPVILLMSRWSRSPCRSGPPSAPRPLMLLWSGDVLPLRLVGEKLCSTVSTFSR